MNQTENIINLVESSFSKLKKDKGQFSAYFYNRLFENSPQLKPLFSHTTIEAQGKKLYAALVLLVENLRHPAELERVLLPLGEKHKGYGVIDQHYPIVAEVLMDSIEFFLKDEFTPDVKHAWNKTLNDVTRTMLIGAGATFSDTKGLSLADTKIEFDKNIIYDLVENSFKKIKPQSVEFSETFYKNLFQRSPELEPLFENTDIKKQAGKLYGALLLLVENIRQPKALEKVLVPLGAKHKGYGTIESHYPVVGAALIETLEEFLKSDWTPEIKQSWLDTYGIVVGLMLQGAKNSTANEEQSQILISKTTLKQSEKAPIIASKLSTKQRSEREAKNRFLRKANDWFWSTSKWKIILGVSILFFLLVPIENKIPLLKDFLDIVEPLSIVLALILYIKESPERKKQFHYQAWSIVDAANGIKNSYARIIALQDLCDDNVSLKGLDLTGAELSGIELNGCDLADVKLSNASLNDAELYSSNLNNADLSHSSCTSIILAKANLGFANLTKAKFSSADFSGANLMFAKLTEGNFSGANFSNANLKGADFEGAYLSGANLEGAEVNLDELEKAYLVKAIMPDGTTRQ